MLCEKPLCGTLPDTERVLDAARQTGTLLWEAFVFPFHAQIAQIRALVADGAIGELMEIKSNFHFPVSNPANIRLSARPGGRRAARRRLLPGPAGRRSSSARSTRPPGRARPGAATASTWTPGACSNYPGGRRLLLSCGFGRSYDTFTRLEGTGGQIHVTNPFHPGPADSYQVLRRAEEPRSSPAAGGRAVVHRR